MRVKFLPQSTIPVVKCNHRYGAKMTYTVQTDSRFENSIWAAEMFGFKYNIRPGCFANNILNQYEEGLWESELTGILRYDIYFAVDYWENPDTGNIELIPDYNRTVWTEEGAKYFNVNVGDPKTARYPRHGKSMYDFSNGRFGYDTATGTMGGNNLQEVIGVEDFMQNWFFSVFGRYPSAGSYRVGDNGGWPTHLKRWLSFRNSVPSPTNLEVEPNTQYGSYLGSPSTPTNRNLFINHPSSAREWDAIYNEGKDKTVILNRMIYYIQLCIVLFGWYRTFIHFHSMFANETLSFFNELFQAFHEAIGSNFVWTCSEGEAMEYMFLREITNSVVATENNGKVTVIADIEDRFKDLDTYGLSQALPLDRINIPLSVEIDLSSTTLAGKAVRPSHGKLINLGSDKYILEVPFSHKESFQSVVIEEGADGYFNTARPTATYVIEGDRLTISSDMPTKAVLYETDVDMAEETSMPSDRINEYRIQHEFTIQEGKDYRVGVISEFLQSNLIKV